jgi:hypothetical protein
MKKDKKAILIPEATTAISNQVVTSTDNCRWTAPDVGNLKLNIDAFFDPNTGFATFGAVVRNSQGLVIPAAANSLPRCREPKEAKGSIQSSRSQVAEGK